MRKRSKIAWQEAGLLKQRVGKLAQLCQLSHFKGNRVFCVESTGAKTAACARVWGLGRIWQQSLKIEPAYVLEVISERFNRLNKQQQDQVLIHELLHIPKNFSGALVPHKRKGGVSERLVKKLYMKMKLPRAYARGIFSPRFVGSGIPPKRKTLRIHPRTYVRGFLRRGMKKT